MALKVTRLSHPHRCTCRPARSVGSRSVPATCTSCRSTFRPQTSPSGRVHVLDRLPTCLSACVVAGGILPVRAPAVRRPHRDVLHQVALGQPGREDGSSSHRRPGRRHTCTAGCEKDMYKNDEEVSLPRFSVCLTTHARLSVQLMWWSFSSTTTDISALSNPMFLGKVTHTHTTLRSQISELSPKSYLPNRCC